jgi:ATP-dependent DNA helicase MPH1
VYSKLMYGSDKLLDHFALAEEDEKVHGVKNDTRAMVFCSYRECVLEVVVRSVLH